MAAVPGGEYELIRGHASKTAEQAERIAGVLTLWADMGRNEVDADAMDNGITLARYYLAEAHRLAGAAAISDAVNKAEALRKWMLSPSCGKDWLTATNVLQRGPNCLRSELPEVLKAIDMLAEQGWLIELPPMTDLDGKKRRHSWRIMSG